MKHIKLGLLAVALLAGVSAYATKEVKTASHLDDVTCKDGTPLPSGCSANGTQLCCIGSDNNPYFRVP